MGSGRDRLYNLVSLIFVTLSILVVVWVLVRLIAG